MSKINRAFTGCRSLSNVYCLAEDVPEGEPDFYPLYDKNSILHVPAKSIEKYKRAYNWNKFANIVALTEEELAIYGDDTPNDALSNSVEGIYMTQPDGYRIYKGNNQPYGNSYEITIADNGDGTYSVDDLFGGWYSQRAGYGPNYSMTGKIEIAQNGIVSLKDSYVKGWGDSLAGLTGTYDSEKKTFTIEEDYVEGMHFYQTWVKVGDIFTVDGITYVINGKNTVSVRRGNEPYSGDIKIPENVLYNDETYTVTSLGKAFSGSENLKSVIIPNTVTSIDAAFTFCTGLTSVTIPSSITSISGAFVGCTALKSVKIPLGVITIGDFNNCTSLETIDMPNSVITIGEWAFQGCTNLSSLTIHSSVVSIGETAFMDCVNLSDLTLSDGLITIGNNAFSYCNGLKKLIIPKSILRIGNSAFAMCEDIESISVDKDNLKYDSRGNCNAIIETYTNRLILGCKNTIIPQDVAIIGNSAFAGCYDLKSLDIPGSVTVIENNAFSGCTGLSSITLDNNIREIGDCAFYGCNRVKTVIIPQKVNAISYRSFENCYDLRDFYCYAEAYPATDKDAFRETPIENATLHVPANLVDTYRYTAPWSGFGKIVALTDNDPKPGDMNCGDINGDGVVNAADIVSVINIINRGATEADISIADLNRDGKVDKDDVEVIVKIIMANK